jgi:hypothetical protein
MNAQEFCEKYLENYTINSDDTIDINDNVDLYDRLGNMTKLPVKFGKVSGGFYCGDNKLTTLEGCPNYVGDSFYCYKNKLTTLEGCPNFISYAFMCDHNNLTTLEYCPKYVGGHFSCEDNKLTTLKGIEKCEILGNFYCRNNKIPPENYIYILTAKIGGDIFTGNDDINNILNTYKNEVKYLHKALSELKKVNA